MFEYFSISILFNFQPSGIMNPKSDHETEKEKKMTITNTFGDSLENYELHSDGDRVPHAYPKRNQNKKNGILKYVNRHISEG